MDIKRKRFSNLHNTLGFFIYVNWKELAIGTFTRVIASGECVPNTSLTCFISVSKHIVFCFGYSGVTNTTNKNIFLYTRKLIFAICSPWIYYISYHLHICFREHFFQQASQMQILFFINSYNQNRIFGIEQFLGNLQTLLHHGKPFAVAILVIAVHIVIVVLPILGSGVIRRIDVNAVHLAGIEIFKKLQSR